MLNGTEWYQKDADFLYELISEFCVTTEELLSSIKNIISVIEEIKTAKPDTNSNIEITVTTSEIVTEAIRVLKEADNVKNNLEKVIDNVMSLKFNL